MIAFDAMLSLARSVGRFAECVAQTGSSATSLIDAVLLGDALNKVGRADDEYSGGTAFMIYDAAGLGAAPENETARITDYSKSTGTLTLATGDLSVAAAAGDLFGVSPIRRDILLRVLNLALSDLGMVPYEDSTSLDTAASTLAYTIPAVAKRDLRQVWIDRSTSSPYYWEQWPYWYQIHGLSTGDLVFTVQPPAGRDIRLIYCAPHATLKLDADAISNQVEPTVLLWQATYRYCRELLQSEEGRDNKAWEMMANEAHQNAEVYRVRYPIRLPAHQVQMAAFPDVGPGQYRIKTTQVPTS
jgi:hypothetical protein